MIKVSYIQYEHEYVLYTYTGGHENPTTGKGVMCYRSESENVLPQRFSLVAGSRSRWGGALFGLSTRTCTSDLRCTDHRLWLP